MRFKKILQAQEDFVKGLISEEEYRDIMEDCDFADLQDCEADECLECEDYEEYEWPRL